VRPEQKRLRRRRFVQRQQQVAYILLWAVSRPARRAHPFRAAERFQQRRQVIARIPPGDLMLLQHMAQQHVKVKLWRNAERGPRLDHRLEKRVAIQQRISNFSIRE
jgi:hypothetical protein